MLEEGTSAEDTMFLFLCTHQNQKHVSPECLFDYGYAVKETTNTSATKLVFTYISAILFTPNLTQESNMRAALPGNFFSTCCCSSSKAGSSGNL